ncbi:MAG TPA: lysyl oxidase family protein [Polyangiaceae bacterium]|nr:lysyl oxidase family protein [Polyangiaceae bacterium]
MDRSRICSPGALFSNALSPFVCACVGLAALGCGHGPDTAQARDTSHVGDASDADARGPREAGGGDAAADVAPGGDDAGDSDAGDSDAGAPLPDAAPEGSTTAPDGEGGVSGPLACGLSACAPGAPCPDLTVDRYDLLNSIVIDERTFSPTDCAIVEGCMAATGTRRLLRFDTGTVNSGTADLSIGDPTQNACFTFSQCHQHYHFRGVGVYTLYQVDGTTVAATGHKQGFCLEDVVPDWSRTPVAPNPATPFDCNHQGLHVGWEDVYPADIDCQWIDITDVPPGDYILSVEINAQHYLPESNYDNNDERVPVTIP